MREPEMLPSYARLGGNGEKEEWGPWVDLAQEREWLEPVHEVSLADWLVERCRRWPSSSYCLAPFPVGFDACARLLHPAGLLTESRDYLPVRWSEVASWNGHTVGALTQFYDITDIYKWNGMEIGSRPAEGKLPAKERELVAGIVREFTGTPTLYYFCFWEGYGQAEFDPEFLSRPKVKIFDRAYYLFRGNLEPDMAGKAFPFRPPTYWWPADRAWCIYTDIDGMDTFIGGSAECIEAVLNHPELETLPITLDDLVD